MKLSFKWCLRLSQIQQEILEELSLHTTKLYNMANYDNIQNGVKSYYDMNKLYESNWHKQFLHSNTYQHCLKVLEQNWKSYFYSIADFKKNPQKYKGMPKPPKYKNLDQKKNEIIFTNLAIRFQDNVLKLSLAKTMQEKFQVKSLNLNVPKELLKLVNFETLQQIRVLWNQSKKDWEMILIYKKEISDIDTSLTNVMAIDLGLSNLATITFQDSLESYVMNGKPLKCVNSYVNKEIARLQSIEMLKSSSEKFKNTKKIMKLRTYRNNCINDYLHKASKNVIDLAIQHNCNTIVIGDLKDIKQNMNFNKSFVQVPIQKFVDFITYKAELKGILVIKISESYTFGCSAIDLEEINKYNYNKTRRTHRGLFVSELGIQINADVNGSLNILRKYNQCTPRLIILARDKGFLDNPLKLRIA